MLPIKAVSLERKIPYKKVYLLQLLFLINNFQLLDKNLGREVSIYATRTLYRKKIDLKAEKCREKKGIF